MAPPKISPDDRFARYTARVGSCLIWSGPTRRGYPMLTDGKRKIAVHRWQLERKLGRALEPTEQCRHSCDTPLCVDPTHLLPGSCHDNKQDSVSRDRHARGERTNTAKLSPLEVEAIRLRVAEGESRRAVAREKGLNRSTVNRIVSRKYWKHL